MQGVQWEEGLWGGVLVRTTLLLSGRGVLGGWGQEIGRLFSILSSPSTTQEAKLKQRLESGFGRPL